MTLPAPVEAAWSTFATGVNVASLQDADYGHLAQFVLALGGAGLGLSDAEEHVLEVGGREGAPEFLAGELMAGVDVGLRVLAASKKAPAGSGPAGSAPAASAPAAKAADSKAAALSKLSPEEKKALGLA